MFGFTRTQLPVRFSMVISRGAAMEMVCRDECFVGCVVGVVIMGI
jgi:hypothetical protein